MKTYSIGSYLLGSYLLAGLTQPIWADTAYPGNQSTNRAQYVMGSLCEIAIFDLPSNDANRAMDAAFNEIRRIENLISTYKSNSEISQLNQSGPNQPIPISETTADLFRISKNLFDKTNGAFNPAIFPLISLWRSANEWPLPQEIQTAAAKSNLGLIHLDLKSSTLTKTQENSGLNFGAIGKGFAVDRAMKILIDHGTEKARINFSGNILVHGPGPENGEWPIQISHPEKPEQTVYSISITSGAISTSSQFLNKRKVGDTWAGHIIDPQSGIPVEASGSATVIATTAADADALSTALFVWGSKSGLDKLKKATPESKGFFIDDAGKVLNTSETAKN